MPDKIIRKRVIDLEPGDVCVGPSIDFTERGTVETTVAMGDEADTFSIHWVGGMFTKRPANYLIDVRSNDD